MVNNKNFHNLKNIFKLVNSMTISKRVFNDKFPGFPKDEYYKSRGPF